MKGKIDMSTELAIATERGQSLAELMGVDSQPSQKATPSIARMNIVNSPIMGLNANGKKEEVVSVGSLVLTVGDDTYYSENTKIRVFAMRYRWQRYNEETNKYERTVLANNLKGDLRDNLGGMNLGKKAGYTSKEEYQALPEHIKKVKRIKVFYGQVTMDNPINEKGETLSSVKSLPFVWDVKNTPSINSIDSVLNAMGRKNLLPLMAWVNLSGTEGGSSPSWGKIEASLGDSSELTSEDNDILTNFLEYIEYTNGNILDAHHELAKGHADEDQGLVNEILNNDFMEVAE